MPTLEDLEIQEQKSTQAIKRYEDLIKKELKTLAKIRPQIEHKRKEENE